MNKSDNIELSVVMPCLNEADTLAVCIRKARQAMREARIDGEVIVADNGSNDGSRGIAAESGANVVQVGSRGYGSALMGGIAVARGKYVIMGDADDSYDFLEIPKFAEKMREGFDLVLGCRLPSGGGKVLPGAMPVLHRLIGNPLFSFLVRKWFRAPVHDVYCGMRGFTKKHYESLEQRCTGMEFATEMIIKSSMFGASITEVPITLHPDGRKSHKPHLKTFRDGWRTLRYFMMLSPRWLFLIPGVLLVLLGVAGYALSLPGVKIGVATLDVHTLLFGTMAVLCGYQAILFAVFAKTFAINEGLLPLDTRFSKLFSILNLERGLFLAFLSIIAGLVLLVHVVLEWHSTGYGMLEYSSTMRRVIPGAMFVVLGFQTVLSSFFVSILGMKHK